jgi:hypothetical protein
MSLLTGVNGEVAGAGLVKQRDCALGGDGLMAGGVRGRIRKRTDRVSREELYG